MEMPSLGQLGEQLARHDFPCLSSRRRWRGHHHAWARFCYPSRLGNAELCSPLAPGGDGDDDDDDEHGLLPATSVS